jgi:aspartyl-tRNA(Asn)/glutamyl-tRNA(Gln) amidotransferase subunit A
MAGRGGRPRHRSTASGSRFWKAKRYGNAAPRDVSPQAVFEFAGAHERHFRSHCGVVGLKPSAGALPAPSGFGGAYGPPYGVTAPVGRTVADAGMTLEIMAGPDPRDQRSVALLDVPPRANPRIAVRAVARPQRFAAVNAAASALLYGERHAQDKDLLGDNVAGLIERG